MAQITGLTAERMLEIEAASVVDGTINADGHLILTTKGGVDIDAGRALDILQYATDAEALAGVVTDKIVTPSNLGADMSRILPGRIKASNNLGSGNDPDNFVDTGWYSGYSWAGSLSVIGSGIGTLVVIRYSSDWIEQTYTNIAGSAQTYRRSFYSGTTWGPWQQMATTDYVDGLVLAKETVANPNLNNYTTQGNWSISQTAWAVAGLNFPEPHAGQLEVRTNPGSTHVWQRFTPYGDYQGAFYTRAYYYGYAAGSQWSPWVRHDTQVEKVQRGLSGGGVRKVSGSGIAWSSRFITMGIGRNVAFAPSGYFTIDMPPDGTVIPVYGTTGSTTRTVTGGYIPLSSTQALYYEIPFQGTATPRPSNFRIVEYTANMPPIPASWILIAVRSSDQLYNPAVTWGDGQLQDYWKDFTLQNSWVAYNTASWPAPSWKFAADGAIETRGLMKLGSTGVPFATVGSAGAPELGVISNQTASNGHARVDVKTSGDLYVIAYIGGGNNAFVCLDNLRWHPAGH